MQAISVEEKCSILVDGIYSYFANTCGIRVSLHESIHPREKHERALKKVTELRNKARKEFRQAKRDGRLREDVQTLAKNFFDLVRQHSKLKRRSLKLRRAESNILSKV